MVAQRFYTTNGKYSHCSKPLKHVKENIYILGYDFIDGDRHGIVIRYVNINGSCFVRLHRLKIRDDLEGYKYMRLKVNFENLDKRLYLGDFEEV